MVAQSVAIRLSNKKKQIEICTFEASLVGTIIVVSCAKSILTFMLVCSLVSPSFSFFVDLELAKT